jgi:addiction module RelE/StbE family toxin
VKIVWTEPAARALESIQDYSAKDNRHAASQVAQKKRQTVILLKDHPRLGSEGRVRGTYELVIPALPYIVPYRVKGSEI